MQKYNLISTFTKLKLAIKSDYWKLHLHIARITMETEMQNKYREKQELKKEVASFRIQLKSTSGLFPY